VYGQKGVASSARQTASHCGQIRGAGWCKVPHIKNPMPQGKCLVTL
jgi:hypothetical protein